MTTRYTAKSRSQSGVAGLPSGYQTQPANDDITVPSVGIEDVDKALFDLFNEQIPLIVGGNGQETKRVPVVFFAGEKWALNKRLRALRDRNDSLILPLVTAIRTSVMQDPASDVSGRGINQQTGEIVIHRRLDKSDRAYQRLINRLFLKHQQNVAVPVHNADPDQLSTLRIVGDLEEDPVVRQGGLLIPDRLNNVYETIVVPAPQFFTSQYEFTFWSQYTLHMNQMIEALLSSFLPQGNSWRLESPKGYWFIASVEDNRYSADLNADDYSQEERLIRYKFTVKVPGYVLASAVPGAPVPIRRYVSSPSISFETGISTELEGGDNSENDPFLGADDPTLPLDAASTERRLNRRDQRRVTGSPLNPNAGVEIDPALHARPRGTSGATFRKVTGRDKNGKIITQYFRVKNVNKFTGETVLSPQNSSDGLTIVLTDS